MGKEFIEKEFEINFSFGLISLGGGWVKLISFPGKKVKRNLSACTKGSTGMRARWRQVGVRAAVSGWLRHTLTEWLVGLLLGIVSSSGSFLRWRTVGLGTVLEHARPTRVIIITRGIALQYTVYYIVTYDVAFSNLQ